MNKDYFINPKSPTLAGTYSASISSSTVLALNSGTTSIEVTAIDKGVFLKWGAVASSSLFDEFIGTGQTRQYVVPTAVASVQFIQESATAKLTVIEK